MGTFCRTELNYLPSSGDWAGPIGAEVEIRDGRVADLPGWQECGFELVAHESAVTDWTDDDLVTSIHHVEIEELARRLTGAEVALVAGHLRRSPEDARRHHQLSPITLVHSDFAAGHVEIIRRNYREGGTASGALSRNGLAVEAVEGASRLLVLQFWRNLGAAKMDFPLAFCDSRTVRPDDGRAFQVSDYAGTGSNFEALGMVLPDEPTRHRWYSFPELRVEEVVAFRTYDTDLVARGETYFTPHSAFRDPEVQVGRPARTSIELRATCLWS